MPLVPALADYCIIHLFDEEGAINYGPGATPYAHKVDEQIPIANLEQCFTTLRTFLDSV